MYPLQIAFYTKTAHVKLAKHEELKFQLYQLAEE
jgi:hypothetical protein